MTLLNSVSKPMQTFTLPLGTVLRHQLGRPGLITGWTGTGNSVRQCGSEKCFGTLKPTKSSTNCKESDPSDPIQCLPMNEFVFWLGHDYSDDKVTSSLIKKHDDVHHPESGRNE